MIFVPCTRLGRTISNRWRVFFRIQYIYIYIYFFFFFNLTYSRWTSSLPSCLWSQRIFPSLPGSRLTIFLSRSKFSTLTTRQPMVEFYLLTFPRFPLRKNTNSTLVRIELTTCAAYLLDHSGDEYCKQQVRPSNRQKSRLALNWSPISAM